MRHSVWRVSACTLLGILFPLTGSAQQYMKAAQITDAQFDGWVSKNDLVKCRAVAHSRYPDGPTAVMLDPKPSGVCYWDLDRAAEVAPPTLVVHAGTRVLIRLKHLRPNETISPAVVFAKIVPPSPGNDIIKNAVNPLQAITLSPRVNPALLLDTSLLACETTSRLFNPGLCQDALIQTINSLQASVNHASAALACLESYQIAFPFVPPESVKPTPSIAGYRCSPSTPINPDHGDESDVDSFAHQKSLIISVINDALKLIPPLSTYNELDAFIIKDPKKYSAEISRDGEIKNAITAIQTAQATLQQSYVLLLALPDSVSNSFYYFDVPALTTATATITAIEVVSKTNSTISTWTTTATSYNVLFSAGLGFSNLVYRTYASSPQIQNGVPVLNSSGNAVSLVTETDNKMSVMAPEVLVSYLIPGLQRLDSACSFGCSLWLSGGVGANLTTKTADFDAGISLRLSDILLTPAVHFGRESRLSNGFTVGNSLGANAPSTLPTGTKWVRKFGFVLSYVIPLT